GPAYLVLWERIQVDDAGSLTTGALLCNHHRRPIARRPLSVRDHLVAGQQFLVCVVPLRPLPARALEEASADRQLTLVERRRALASHLLLLLARMKDVVDLAVALRPAQSCIGAARAVGVKALRVALMEIHAGVP